MIFYCLKKGQIRFFCIRAHISYIKMYALKAILLFFFKINYNIKS